MSESQTHPASEPSQVAETPVYTPSYFKPKLYGIGIIVAAMALAGIMLVSRYAALDLARDMRGWQDKLNLIADSRASAVTDWVDSHFKELKKLSDNPSLQLYFTELTSLPEGSKTENNQEPAQKTYLRNLLIFTADRMGFAPQQVPLSLQIPTQISYEAPSGIAVLDNSNQIVVSTPYLASLDSHLIEQLKKIPPGTPAFIDMYKSETGKVQVGFVMPVFGIQADPANSFPIGRIIGIKPVDESLFKLLHHPGITEKTLEAALVRVDSDNVTYLSPLADGNGPMEKSLAAGSPGLADAFAIANPGSFAEKQDYASRDVLVTGRSIPGTPWSLVLKIDREEALAESDIRRNSMIVAFFLVLAIVVATVVAVWHNASSRRSLIASRYFRDLAERATAQERLLKLVTDNQPESIYILDSDNRYRFANRQAAAAAVMPPEDMNGKPIGDVLGTARAQDIVSIVKDSLEQQQQIARVKRFSDDGEEKILRAEYIPLKHVPIPGLEENTPGVLVVEQDISEVVHEREKRIRMHRQLVDTLVMMVDKRDPYAANHSQVVAQIAFEVAHAMELDPVTCETARLAGSLMNVGKMVVPTHVLTKRDSLNEEEIRSIRDSLYASAELLEGVSFDGPVVETLRQAQEHWDGSGPDGIKEEGILISARIVAAVNAFVGMISSRSYRPAMPIDRAIKVLLEKVDVQFDRRVVVALANYVDNLGGRAMIEQLQSDLREQAA